MSDPGLERLFWDEVDGPPSAERRRRIRELGGETPEARRQLAALEELASTLAAVTEVEPPVELRAELRRQVASRAAGRVPTATWGAAWLRLALAGGWRPRLAWAAAAVLAVVVGHQLFVGGSPPASDHDRSRLSGALNVGGGASSAPYEMVLAESAGTVRFSREGSALVVRLEPAAGATLELALEADGRGLEPLRVSGSGRLRHDGGAAEVIRLVADGPAALAVAVAGGDWQGVTARVFTAAGATVLEERLDGARLTGGGSSSPTSDPVAGSKR